MIDYTQLSDDELETEFTRINAERTRRQGLDSVYREIEDVLDNAERKGIIQRHEPGQEWVQPTHAGDAYRRGDVVVHEGKEWVSTVTPNVWEPGVSGWHHAPEVDPETGEPGTPEWVRPSGAHDAYEQGDRVLYNGEIYESIHPTANTWSPDEYPQGWQLIEGEDS